MKPIRIDDPVCWSPRVKDTRQSMRFVPSAINGFVLTVILVDNPDAAALATSLRAPADFLVMPPVP